jgi:hypothetical protein
MKKETIVSMKKTLEANAVSIEEGIKTIAKLQRMLSVIAEEEKITLAVSKDKTVISLLNTVVIWENFISTSVYSTLSHDTKGEVETTLYDVRKRLIEAEDNARLAYIKRPEEVYKARQDKILAKKLAVSTPPQ